MPVTPLHLGPASIVKGLIFNYFSFVLFALIQFLMDIEVVFRIILNADIIHGYTNTLGGATLVLIPSVYLGRPASNYLLNWWNNNLGENLQNLVILNIPISWKATWITSVTGVYSHWFLDAIMHADAAALWPFSNTNPFHGWLGINQLNYLCIITLFVGCLFIFITRGLRRLNNDK